FIYNFNYYGIGTNAVEQNEEVFGIEFPRVRLTALRQVYPNLYLGPRFWYDNIDITEVEDQGLLDLGNVPGRSGGHISGVGLTAIWDSRDIIFFPSNGIFAEFTLLPHNSATGSDFNFLRMEMNAAHYQTVFKKHVLASNLILSKSNGTVPFTQMGLLGGTKRMRGFYEGRFRDRNMWVGQLEYRIPLKWRFGVNFFGAVGDVSPNLDSFQIKNTKAAYGLGLRYMFDLEKKLNIRLDMGFTEEGSNFYVTFGEAF
ncbi:MAG: BamA/TamA family outer membrane protein, partial [Flavobacteriales bacterium]|nr:BamA/TamA family outer membrane protein [Flavobacteriales bacterium]